MKRILIISDGKAGHLNQSIAFCKIKEVSYDILEVKFKSKFHKALSYLFDRFDYFTDILFDEYKRYYFDFYDAIISAGSGTYYFNKYFIMDILLSFFFLIIASIVGISLCLLLGMNSYLKIAILVMCIFIPMELYNEYFHKKNNTSKKILYQCIIHNQIH